MATILFVCVLIALESNGLVRYLSEPDPFTLEPNEDERAFTLVMEFP